MLNLEMQKKDRLIESLKSENLDPNISRRKAHTSANSLSFLQQRKKERDFESKIEKLESTISDERKHMGRLQQLNTQLLSKIKSITNSDKINIDESESYSHQIKVLKQDN